MVSFWNLFSDLLIPRLVWEPGLFLIVNALFWRNALLRWLIIACLGRSVAIAAFVGTARCSTDAPEVNLFGPVRSNFELTCVVSCDQTAVLLTRSDNFRTSDSLWLFRLGPLIFRWVSSYSFLYFRELLVIEPVFVYLIETRLGRLDSPGFLGCLDCIGCVLSNTQACSSVREKIIIFYYCDERPSKPRELTPQ